MMIANTTIIAPLSVWVWVEATPLPYLIFFMNAVNAVRVNFLGECKKIPEEPENYCFVLRLYRNSECIISH